MRTPNLLLVSAAIVSLCVMVAITPAAQGGKQPSDIPVTSTLNITGDISQGTNYQIEGDGLGPYVNGLNSVSSVLQGSSGDWVLDLTSSKTETVLFDLRDSVPNSGAKQIFSYTYLPTRIIVKCSEAIAGSFPAMKLNQTLSCPTGIAITYAGTQYGLMMSSGPNSDIDYAETNNPQVTCTAVNPATTKCISWTVAPIQQATGPVENIARLRQPLKCGGCFANLGDFYVKFNFTVTNP
jgi:hypothetical protein